MRVLFTMISGFGHFYPLAALAQSLSRRGHDVSFAASSDFVAHVEEAGIRALSAGVSEAERVAEALSRFPELNDLPLEERAAARIPITFGQIAAPALLSDLVVLFESWTPDVIVHDTTEFAGPLAAALAGIPSVGHSLGMPVNPAGAKRIAGEFVPKLWRERGLQPDEHCGMYSHLFIDSCPPSLREPRDAFPCPVVDVRPETYEPRSGVPPTWLADLADRPTVYVTLGTVSGFNSATDVFRAVIEGLQNEPLNVVVTVGDNNDPAALGPLPPHVRVEKFIPIALVLPLCSAVVCHGGAGTTLAALGLGVPMLVLPRGARSQSATAARLAELGAARMLAPADVTPETVRKNVLSLLGTASYADAAARLRAEIDSMPPTSEAAAVVERLSGGSGGGSV